MTWCDPGPIAGNARVPHERRLRVLVCDASAAERNRLHTLLAEDADIEIVGWSSDGMHAMSLVGDRHPDVVLTGMELCGISGLDLVRLLSTHTVIPHPGIVAVIAADDEVLIPLLRTDVNGVVEHDAGRDNLTYAIRAAAVGEAVLSPRIARRLIDLFRRYNSR